MNTPNKLHIKLLPAIAIIFSLLFYACEDDKTCDEYTESNLIVKLVHNQAAKIKTLTQPKFDSVKFVRVSEQKALLIGNQLEKATLFFDGDSFPQITDTIDIIGAETDSITLYSTAKTRLHINASYLAPLFAHEDQIDSILIGGDNLSTLFYNSRTDAAIALPLDFTSDISRYTFTTTNITDFFQITYSTEQELLSPTCGFVFNFTIKDDTEKNTHSLQIIDSIKITNKYVTPQSTKAHIIIYY